MTVAKKGRGCMYFRFRHPMWTSEHTDCYAVEDTRYYP